MDYNAVPQTLTAPLHLPQGALNASPCALQRTLRSMVDVRASAFILANPFR